MSEIISLFQRTQNAKHWSARDILQEAIKDLDKGLIGENDRMVIVTVNPDGTGRFDTHFIQCGMSASEMIMLLEIAKMDIYKNQMCGGE